MSELASYLWDLLRGWEHGCAIGPLTRECQELCRLRNDPVPSSADIQEAVKELFRAGRVALGDGGEWSVVYERAKPAAREEARELQGVLF